MNSQNDVTYLVAAICDANTLKQSLDLYREYKSELKGWQFVFSSDSGHIPGFSIERRFASGAMVCSLFSTDKIIVLDEATLNEMENGVSTYAYDSSISLDTQAVSYLEPYLSGKSARIRSDFEDVFKFIANQHVNVDPLPYILENQQNMQDENNLHRIFEKVKAYEVLRTLNTKLINEEGVAASMLNEQELNAKAQQFLSKIMYMMGNDTAIKEITVWHTLFYCLLLKMVEVQFVGKKSNKEKIDEFMDFMDNGVATICGREGILAKQYFEKGQSMRFFKKIQKNKDDVLEQLKNMAWDLLHIRHIEMAMTYRPEKEARYFFPALLTFDKGLIEVFKLYPLKACAMPPSEHAVLPFYEKDWIGVMSEYHEDYEGFAQKYFSRDAVDRRDRARENVRRKIQGTVSELEAKVMDLIYP